MINYELAILIAVLSYTYTNLLTEPDMVFNGLYRFLYNLFHHHRKEEEGDYWAFKILIGCEKCNAGQIALWVFIYQFHLDFIFNPLETIGYMLLFVSFTILTVYTLKQTNDRLWTKN